MLSSLHLLRGLVLECLALKKLDFVSEVCWRFGEESKLCGEGLLFLNMVRVGLASLCP